MEGSNPFLWLDHYRFVRQLRRMTSPSIIPAAQLTALNHFVLNKYTDIAAIILIGYECLITMEMEVELVWKSRWNLTKILYLLNRYVTIVDAIVLVYRVDTKPSSCKPLLFAAGALYMSGIFVSESIFIMRVIVVWKTTMKKYMFVIVLLGVIYTAVVIYFLTRFMLLLRPLKFFTLLPFGGCLVAPEGPKSWEEYTFWKEYTCLLVYDAVMLASMVYPTIKTCWPLSRQSALLRHIHVEGVIFYVYLFLFDILCLAMQLSFHSALRGVRTPNIIQRHLSNLLHQA
ncbi:hypothetical protein AGABI2DRAFT_115615 [Agaricus bisporus var. bisporus H97]|uniref:hypothetical protein n=1 Tax=Agaricus bisporus var. bisporus (strain H97 / ATCC MYA-4626 / FGSC 10389) TaxID=936046 RepID=UPI00029F5EB0|nr:hypothetical protein AGABI2DRAFT_115615 [Agaricus bisporus var. bisporus H97]EKV50541.1 hypothetical protein AGABI2DRAFT_115615 [Agaricus bisporus var. bisporus H97]